MSSREDFAFFHPMRVRWADADPQGIVFYPEYFVYFDVAMTEYMRRMGLDATAMEDFVTVHAEADYRGSARWDDEIEIGVRCTRLGRSSMTLAFAVFRGSEALTEGENTYVRIDPDALASEPLGEDLVERIREFERVEPER